MTTPEPEKLTPEELAELHALPDEAMVKPEEAAARSDRSPSGSTATGSLRCCSSSDTASRWPTG